MPENSLSRPEADVPPALVEATRTARRITVLTGAGMSAESGIPTFRDALSGLWSTFNPHDLATREGFVRDPALVWVGMKHDAKAWPEHSRMRAIAR